MFLDRVDAGVQLAQALKREPVPEPVVLALPRGGVPVAAEIARALKAPLDLVMVRKLGTPGQPELAMGAVARCGNATDTILNEDIVCELAIPEQVINAAKQRELGVIAERERRYLGGRKRAPVADRTAVIVDDGVATGATTIAALRAVRRLNPKRIILAIPVAPPHTVARLKREADSVLCLLQPHPFGAISLFYNRFPQLSDQQVIALLDELGQPRVSDN